jgi:ATP-dependent helicase/nuclease subunit B
MSVRFVIGRAGSGKTHHCLTAIQNQLQQDAFIGPKLLLIVPEQASLQMERALLSCNFDPQSYNNDSSPPPIRATHRGEVLSFRRLAARLLQSSPAVTRRALTPAARSMILRHLLQQHARNLQYYANVDRWPGFISQLSQTVVELIHEGVTPNELAEQQHDPTSDPRTKKLADIQLIYAAYLNRLTPDLLDPTQQLTLALDLIDDCPWLKNAHIWVDGFAGFTGLERTILTRLAKYGDSIEITLLADPETLTPPTESATPATNDLFTKTIRTYHKLHQALGAANIPINDALFLNPPLCPRFKKNDSLCQLERAFIKGESTGVEPVNITLIQAADRRIEVEFAVSKIATWVRDHDHRYRDTAVIVRDMPAFADLIAESLDRHQIPYFIDRRKPVNHHPLAELIRSLVAVAAESFSLSSVRAIIRTGLLDISSNQADQLENYLLATGINSLEEWSHKWTRHPAARLGKSDKVTEKKTNDDLRQLNRIRIKLLDQLTTWLNETNKLPQRTGRSWSKLFIDIFIHLQVGRRLAEWTAAAENDGNLNLAEEHRQVWRDVAEFLQGIDIAFHDEELALADLPAIIQSGLADLTLGLAPPMIDQVLVGSIERSRHPDIRSAVILGLNEGNFPARLDEDPILNDDDREFLQSISLDIGQPARQRIVDERMLFYVAITRPSEHLAVSYALADEDGRELRPSEYIDEFKRIAPNLKTTTIENPTTTGESWPVLTPKDLGQHLSAVLRHSEEGATSSEFQSRYRIWQQVYEIARQREDLQRLLRQSLAGLKAPQPATLSPEIAGDLYPQPLATSISRLERQAECPFKHFAQFGLNLTERTTAPFQAMDIGSIHHAILEDLFAGWAANDSSINDITPHQISTDIADSFDRVRAQLALDQSLSTARDRYIAENISRWTERAVERQRPITGRGAYKPRATEVRFGIKHEDAIPALKLTTPKKREVHLRGIIDRVDLAELTDELLGIVIDYKTTRDIKLDMTKVFHGLSLQLVSYLLALQESGTTLAGRSIRPVGALYAPLKKGYEAVDHPDEAKPQHAHSKWSGLIDFSKYCHLDPDTAGQYSTAFNVFIKKSGELGNQHNSDAVDPVEFRSVLNHTKQKLSELADDILDGHIRVAPYILNRSTPCQWCPMKSVCRFELSESGDIRPLQSYQRIDAVRQMIEIAKTEPIK